MVEFRLSLPCTASDVERFIHMHCDHHGFPNCEVSTDGTSLVLRYSDPVAQPSTEGLKRVIC